MEKEQNKYIIKFDGSKLEQFIIIISAIGTLLGDFISICLSKNKLIIETLDIGNVCIIMAELNLNWFKEYISGYYYSDSENSISTATTLRSDAVDNKCKEVYLCFHLDSFIQLLKKIPKATPYVSISSDITNENKPSSKATIEYECKNGFKFSSFLNINDIQGDRPDYNLDFGPQKSITVVIKSSILRELINTLSVSNISDNNAVNDSKLLVYIDATKIIFACSLDCIIINTVCIPYYPQDTSSSSKIKIILPKSDEFVKIDENLAEKKYFYAGYSMKYSKAIVHKCYKLSAVSILSFSTAHNDSCRIRFEMKEPSANTFNTTGLIDFTIAPINNELLTNISDILNSYKSKTREIIKENEKIEKPNIIQQHQQKNKPLPSQINKITNYKNLLQTKKRERPETIENEEPLLKKQKCTKSNSIQDDSSSSDEFNFLNISSTSSYSNDNEDTSKD